MFHWLTFLTYAISTAVTPGPNNILSMTNAGRLGFRRSLPFNFGIWGGFSVVMVLCTLFCSMLSSIIPKIKLPILIIGAIYMLYLAWKTFTGTTALEENDSKSGFISGFAFQFINPKIYIYGIISMEIYILPFYSNETLALLGFSLLLAFIGFVFTLCWSAFGSVFRLLFSKYAKVTNAALSLMLVYCAASLFL